MRLFLCGQCARRLPAGGPAKDAVMQQNSSPFGRISPQAWQHRRRCENLPPLERDEAEHLIAAYLAAKSVTICPTRYAAPVEQRPLYSREE